MKPSQPDTLLTEIEKLHALYNQFTGFHLSMKYDRERSWYEFIKAGHSQEELRTVLLYLRGEERKCKRHLACLGFRRLIECLDTFEEELALALAYSRNNRPQTHREEIVKVFRPEAVPELKKDYSLPAREVIKRLIEEMKKAAQ